MKNLREQIKKIHLTKRARTQSVSGLIKKNYLAWIANFGVVPLFLLAAFLLAPALFFLAALLLLVTLVRETIFQLLSTLNQFIYYSKLRRYFLPISGRSVKRFLCILTSFFLFSPVSFAESPSSESLILTLGEIKSVELQRNERYFYANKEIIKIKEDMAQQRLSVLAKQTGSTVLHIYQNRTLKKKWFIKVIDSKRTEFQLMEELKNLALETSIRGEKVVLNGTVHRYEDYLTISGYKKTYPNKFLLEKLNYSNELKKEIIAKAYQQLFKQNIYSAKCFFDLSDLFCKIDPAEIKNENFKEMISKMDFAKFLINEDSQNRQNFKFKIKLFQIENLQAEEVSFGLEQLDTNLKELISSPLADIISKNSIKLKNANVNLSTLAEPTIICQLNEKSEFQLGNENPYKTSESQRAKIEWKFSGLKIEFKIQKYNQDLYLEYQSELTSPGNDQSINGSKGKSQIKLNLNSPILLFHVSMRNQTIDQQSMPFIGKIPILGHLFQAKNKSQNMKSLYAIVEVSEYAY